MLILQRGLGKWVEVDLLRRYVFVCMLIFIACLMLGMASKLLDHENRASDQVPLLLSMKEDRLALIKAVDSGDTDLSMFSQQFIDYSTYSLILLVHHVLLHLHKRLPLGDFFRLIEDGGMTLAPASHLLQVYAREQNREMLRDFYYSDDRRVESAVLSLDEASRMSVSVLLCIVYFVVLY